MDTIYNYKATFPFSKIFFRKYEIKGTTTLFQLHRYLLDDLGFAPDQMIAFKGLGEDGKVKSIYGLFDMGAGTMDGVTIEKTISKGETELLYLFDIKKNHYIKLSLEGTSDFVIHASYPRLVQEKGRIPEQFAAKYDNYDLIPDVPGINDTTSDSFNNDELPEGEEGEDVGDAGGGDSGCGE